jgi:hypothetical protein
MSTLTISKNSLFMRFFLWAWDVDPANLNICKLFWGTVLFPFAFCTWKMANRFFPKITILYLMGGGSCMVAFIFFHRMGLLFAGSLWLLCALLSIIFGKKVVASLDKKTAAAKAEQKLARVTASGSWVGEKFGDVLYYIVTFFTTAYETRPGQIMSNFFHVVCEYLRGLREQTCVRVKVS